MLWLAVLGEVLSGCYLRWFCIFCYLLILWVHCCHYSEGSNPGQLEIKLVLEQIKDRGHLLWSQEEGISTSMFFIWMFFKVIYFLEEYLFPSKDTAPLLYIRFSWKVWCKSNFWKSHCLKFKLGSVILKKPLTNSSASYDKHFFITRTKGDS